MLEKLKQLLKAIDTYEAGHVLERDFMKFVLADDLDGMGKLYDDDVIIINVLLNNYFMQVATSRAGRIILFEMGDISILGEVKHSDLAPSFVILENERFDEVKFEKYVKGFANETLKRIIYPNYVALKQFVHEQASAIYGEEKPYESLGEIIEIWELNAKAIEEELPRKFNISDNLFLYFLKRSVAGELLGNLMQDGIEFEMEGQPFNLWLDVTKKAFTLTKKGYDNPH